jgi:hypothetical protein
VGILNGQISVSFERKKRGHFKEKQSLSHLKEKTWAFKTTNSVSFEKSI